MAFIHFQITDLCINVFTVTLRNFPCSGTFILPATIFDISLCFFIVYQLTMVLLRVEDLGECPRADKDRIERPIEGIKILPNRIKFKVVRHLM